jgi:hypothetical protein
MQLSYLHDECHKQAVTHIRESQRFESMYTLHGKTRPTRYMLPTLSLRMVQDYTYLTCPHIATLQETLTDLDRSHYSREKGSRHNP